MSRYPAPPPDAVSVELEIPFHDVDILQVAWHGHYCKYLEIARTALLRACRLDAADMIPLGFRFMVAETQLRHVYPLRYGERVRVAAWLTELENRIRIQYDLLNVTRGCRSAQAHTVLVTTSAEGELCWETPAPVLQRLRALPRNARS